MLKTLGTMTLSEFVTEWNEKVGRNNTLTTGSTPDKTLRYLEKCATESMIIQTGTFAEYDIANDGTINLTTNITEEL